MLDPAVDLHTVFISHIKDGEYEIYIPGHSANSIKAGSIRLFKRLEDLPDEFIEKYTMIKAGGITYADYVRSNTETGWLEGDPDSMSARLLISTDSIDQLLNRATKWEITCKIKT
jgi:hypothetical protein